MANPHRETVCNDFLEYIQKIQTSSGLDKDLIKALAIVWAGQGTYK